MSHSDFSMEEAIILLDVFLTKRLQGVSLQESGAIASKRLREYALKQGKAIDTSFRSASGVSDRMRSMEAAYYGNESSTTPATEMFCKAVELYRSNPEKNRTILQNTQKTEMELPVSSILTKMSERNGDHMSANVEVGKFTLESLTTGMYEQPLIVYREYLQNAADALEDALRQNIISERDMSVTIRIDSAERTIEVYDNGSGINAESAGAVLLSIGSSQKEHTLSRGFRGIGCLGEISYCDRLEFETTAFDEMIGTKVVFDCAKLKALMLPGESTNMSMQDVVSQSSSLHSFEALPEEHYFIVRMIGVDERTNLLDEEAVSTYLSQTAPVAYSPYFSMLSSHIYSFLQTHDVNLTEFPVSVSYDGARPKALTKAFQRRYTAGRGKDADQDAIYEIETFTVSGKDEKIMALGWYAKSAWLGTLKEDSIRGLRLRKGNIQIGDEHILDRIFKQSRFNGWTQGEVFVISDELIPNARRDNFEQNTAFFTLIEQLRNTVGTEISDRIVEASQTRNDPVQKAVKSSDSLIHEVDEKQQNGFNSRDEAENARSNVETTIQRLTRMKTSRPEVKQAQQATVERLSGILDTMSEGNTNYKLNKLQGIIGRKEKRILCLNRLCVNVGILWKRRMNRKKIEKTDTLNGLIRMRSSQNGSDFSVA